MNLKLIYLKLYTFLLNIAYKKKYCVFLLSILLLVSIDILSYNHIALGTSDNNGDDDNDNDDVPFILPVPFP